MRETGKALRPVSFSARTLWDTQPSDLAVAVATRRRQGLPIYDLTASNPTRCGFSYDKDMLRELQQSAALQYDPDPLGALLAREAVCRYYSGHEALVSRELGVPAFLDLEPAQVTLTTSTSEAYSFLFRLLCDPGGEILIAQPSYPLFDFLAALDDIRLIPYPLFYDFGWHLDVHALREKITPRTRAIVVVHPNNPTGNFTHAQDRHFLEELCVEYGLALIVDEVFLDYSFGEPVPSFATGSHPALTFVLSGLSKIAALPQMKLSWIAAFGPEDTRNRALSRLEIIADTFLSVSTPLQLALPHWLSGREATQGQIIQRVTGNLSHLDRLLRARKLFERCAVEGGWSVILRGPALETAEVTAIDLLSQTGVLLHPGSYFGLPEKGWFVFSLLGQSEEFCSGAEAALAFFVDRAREIQ